MIYILTILLCTISANAYSMSNKNLVSSVQDWKSWSPLHNLVRQNKIPTLLSFLESGRFNPDQLDEKGGTPLMLAALMRNCRAAEVLLKHGAEPDVYAHLHNRKSRDPKRDVCVVYLSKKGHGIESEVCDQKNCRRPSPLLLAALNGDLPMFNLLLGKSIRGAHQEDCNGQTAAMYAVQSGNQDLVREFYRLLGRDIFIPTSQAETILFPALKNEQLFYFLLPKAPEGIQIKFQQECRDKIAPYEWASFLGNALKSVPAMEQWGSFLDLQSYDYNLFVLACEFGAGPEALIYIRDKYGYPVNTRDDEGMTGLMIAAEEGHRDTVLWLCGNGAGIGLKNKKKQTALTLASEHPDVCAILRRYKK